jgi:hypothetical protein
MSVTSDAAGHAVKLLAAFFAAKDEAARAEIDPDGGTQELSDFLQRWFASSPDASTVLTRFQEEPGNPSVAAVVRGRISEALLISSEFAGQLDAALARASSARPLGVQQIVSEGHAAAVSDIGGKVSIRQRSVKIGQLDIPMPTFLIFLLLGGGLVVGGGAAIVSAPSDVGAYIYYMTPEQASQTLNEHEFVLLEWRTQQDGSLTGNIKEDRVGGSRSWLEGVDLFETGLSGHQDGKTVEITMTVTVVGTTITSHGTISGDTLMLSFPFGPMEVLRRTTPDEYTKIVSDYKQQHPSSAISAYGVTRSCTVTVTADSLIARSGPDGNAPVVDTYHKGGSGVSRSHDAQRFPAAPTGPLGRTGVS